MHMTTEDRLRLHLAGKDVTWRTEGAATLATWTEDGAARAAILLATTPTAASIVDAYLVARGTNARLTLVHDAPLSPTALRSASRFGLALLDAATLPEPAPAAATPAPAQPEPAAILADVVLPLAPEPEPIAVTLQPKPPAPIEALPEPAPTPLPLLPAPEPALPLLPAHEEPILALPERLPAPEPVAPEAAPAAVEATVVAEAEAPAFPVAADVSLAEPAAVEPAAVEPATFEPAMAEPAPEPVPVAEPAVVAVEPTPPGMAEPVPAEVNVEVTLQAEAPAPAPELEITLAAEAPAEEPAPEEPAPAPVVAPIPAEVTVPLLEPGFRLPWDLPAGAAQPETTTTVHVSAAELAALPWHEHAPIEEHVEIMPGNARPRRYADRPTTLGAAAAPAGGTWGLPWPRPVAPTDGLSVADPRIWSSQERVHAMREDLDARLGAASFGAVKQPDGSPWIKRIQTFGSP